MTVSVLLFAALRERAGTDRLELQLPDGATVADALTALRENPALGELLARLPVHMAVNRDYAQLHTPLALDDELALIPPLSGGAEASTAKPRIHVAVGEQEPSVERISAQVSDPRAGAVVTFQGVTREVSRLEYEAYVEMARERIAAILADCVIAHGLCAAAAEHRIGAVARSESSVVVAVSAPHREEAFAGAREAIDRIKAEAPIWKVEVAADGSERRVAGTPAPGGERKMSDDRLTHLDEQGRARMVDVGAKDPHERVARARARVRMSPETASAVARGDVPKGDVLTTARLAGIQAAKQAGQLIPLAHPITLTFIDVQGSVDPPGGIVELIGEVHAVDRTGVEMEAMTACAVAALTVYDMVKGIERGVEIEQVVLLEKNGGRSDWRRDDAEGLSG
jgi:molybdopterin synthase catalytic subunit